MDSNLTKSSTQLAGLLSNSGHKNHNLSQSMYTPTAEILDSKLYNINNELQKTKRKKIDFKEICKR
jgi:hypothetical protein